MKRASSFTVWDGEDSDMAIQLVVEGESVFFRIDEAHARALALRLEATCRRRYERRHESKNETEDGSA